MNWKYPTAKLRIRIVYLPPVLGRSLSGAVTSRLFTRLSVDVTCLLIYPSLYFLMS